MPEPFDLNLRHLRAVVAIIDHGSLNAAAAAVSLSQPALTQGLSKLERQLATNLFDRRPHGIRPTVAGVALADRVRTTMDHLSLGAARSRGKTRGFARPEQLMTSAQLRGFLALAAEGSFVAAAVATTLSQPAIHRAVRDLEQQLGAVLVERRGRGVALTPNGRAMARAARLARAEIVAAIAETAPIEAMRLTIGAMPLSRARLLPQAINLLLRASPGMTVDIVEGSWGDLVEPLRDGVIDLMIGALRDEPPTDLLQVPLMLDRLSIIGRAGHPLAGPDAPDPAALACYPWIVGRRGSPLRAYWEAVFPAGSRPSAPIECGSVMTLREVMVDSDFLTLLSPTQVSMELHTGLLATLGPPLVGATRRIGVTTRAGWRPTRSHARLIDLLDQVAKTIPEIE